MKNFIQIVLCFLITLPFTFAQTRVQKESNEDLRNARMKFALENISEVEKIELVENNGSFTVMHSLNKKNLSRKISGKSAEEIDQQFLEMFLNLKYKQPEFNGKDCSIVFKMSMRMDSYEICKGESEKIALAKSLLENLKKVL